MFVPIALVLFCATAHARADSTRSDSQYILLNIAPGQSWHQQKPDKFTRESFELIKTALPTPEGARIRVGVGFVFSYLRSAELDVMFETMERLLDLAAETDTPIVIQLDCENWWDGHPELWNWWDPSKPGYDPDNRRNVEWTDWGPEHAVRIAWRNWGRQLRVLPPPNLMSPAYREVWQRKLREIMPVIVTWWRSLPPEKRDLFVGVKVGHESSIGVNAWYYPDGNALAGQPSEDDPVTRMDHNDVTARGVVQLGHAALTTAGIRTEGKIQEAELVEVVRRHLEDQCRIVRRSGIPRELLYTHGAGWKDEELLYSAAVNAYACPGWSFYKHAIDPRLDLGVRRELKHSDAPSWAAAEWLYMGPKTVESWRGALENTLADRNCRYMCIFNWEGIREHEPVLEAIRQVVADSVPRQAENASKPARVGSE